MTNWLQVTGTAARQDGDPALVDSVLVDRVLVGQRRTLVRALAGAEERLRKKGAVQALAFLATVLRHWPDAVAWSSFLSRHAPWFAPRGRDGRLFGRAFRPYLRSWLPVSGRMRMIAAHYRLLIARFQPGVLGRLLDGEPLLLAETVGRGGGRYQITLGQEVSKEGELNLCFTDLGAATVLAVIRGTFGPDLAGRPAFWLGSLQGPKPPVGRDEIVAATRDLDNLRPKHAAFHALAALCLALGVDTIIAPGRSNHVSCHRTWRTGRLDPRRIQSDYEAFWGEFGSEPLPDGDHRLPLPWPRRDEEDVSPKRRKVWRQRHERLDGIAGETQARVQGWSRQ